MTRIVLHGLSKKLRNVEAVRGIELVVEDGELAVLVGPSGCGKTTTLRMITDREHVAEGQPTAAKRPGESVRLQAAMDNMRLIDVATGKVVAG